MLTGLLAPTGGAATVAGHDVYTESEAHQARHRLHEPALLALRGPHGRARTSGSTAASTISRDREIRERTDAHARAPRPRARGRATLVRAIPLGWRQKLAFSVALLHEPRIVFLDEPTSGVDPITRRQFWELIYEAAAARHDRARHDALHGRSGVLRPHLDHGGRADRRDGHAGRAEAAVRRRVDRRAVRAAGAPDADMAPRRSQGQRAVSALARPAAEGDVPHPARPPDAGRHRRCCRSCR